MNRRLLRLGVIAVAVFAACGSEPEEADVGAVESSLARPTPTGGVFAVFDVGGEPLSIWVTNETGIKQALQMARGIGVSRHPSGMLVCSTPSPSGSAATEWNAPWSWHLDGSTVIFAQTSIELCDGLPSFVEAGPCERFGNGSFCPWSAKLLSLRDCRNSSATPPNCPLVR